MAQDYAKLKNAELENLLKQRGLPHTGKKADLVARLQDDDAKEAAKVTVDHPEDEIDWDDDEPLDPIPSTVVPAPAEAKAAAVAQKSEEPADAAQTETMTSPTNGNAAPTTQAPDTSSNTVTGAAAQDAESMNIDVDAEIQARIARIDKFTNQNDPDSLKWAEEEKAKIRRLQSKGAEDFAKEKLTTQATSIDKALPIRRERGEKRKRDGNDEGSGRRGRGRQGGGGGREDRRHHPYRGERRNDQRQQKSGGGGGGGRKNDGLPKWMSEKDRAAAQARKDRFA